MRRRQPTHPPKVIDAGLQSERTYLAWQRTALAFAGVGALLIYGLCRMGAPSPFPAGSDCSSGSSCSPGRNGVTA
ncbi:DUF202 domain-containing protein [Micromonospora thermarum]|uniref:DUF202 domain-containing protein n=1 Tax=Micromonospora thermarum TaxID=2720024 RepID=A0ABX0ZGF6_9ACTN|nr:DUF202 domain-containing protein [Micromonospora thermarum]